MSGFEGNMKFKTKIIIISLLKGFSWQKRVCVNVQYYYTTILPTCTYMSIYIYFQPTIPTST